MGYSAKVLADSISPDGFRITSFEVTFPRIILAEVNTHRILSRNSASSRAVPVKTTLAKIEQDPFEPCFWGRNQRGMSAKEEVTGSALEKAKEIWHRLRRAAMEGVSELADPEGIDLHKQIANRLLEPWMFHTAILTGTEWSNLFNLRRDKDAQPEFRKPANLMYEAMGASVPEKLSYGQWHLPLVKGIDFDRLIDEGYSELELAQISCGRCARVSYLTHSGERDPKADIALAMERLVPSGHLSPLEHAARPMVRHELELFRQKGYKVDSSGHLMFDPDAKPTYFLGNAQGWIQLRKMIPGEAVFRAPDVS